MLRGHALPLLHGPAAPSLRHFVHGSLQADSGSRAISQTLPMSSTSGDHPPFLVRSISALAVQRIKEPLPEGSADRSLSGPSSRSEGQVWDMRRRAFKPREGKERQLDHPDESAQQPPSAFDHLRRLFPDVESTLQPVSDHALAFSLTTEPRSHRLGIRPSVDRLSFAERRLVRPPRARIPAWSTRRTTPLSTRTRDRFRTTEVSTPPHLPPLTDSLASLDPPPPPPPFLSSPALPSVTRAPDLAANAAEVPAPHVSQLLILHDHALDSPTRCGISTALQMHLRLHYRPSLASAPRSAAEHDTSNSAASSEVRAVGVDVTTLVQALGAGLGPYQSPSVAALAPEPPALAEECAALIRRCLESKRKSHEDWYWLSRAELHLRELSFDEIRGHFRHVCASPILEHSLPLLYAMVASPKSDAGYEAASMLARASPSYSLSTSNARAQLRIIFGVILRRLVVDEDGEEGLKQMLWVLERRAARGDISRDERLFLPSLSNHLLNASPSTAQPELALDICARVLGQPHLLPSSGAIARLGLSFSDSLFVARLLVQGAMRPRHAVLLIERMLTRLDGEEPDYDRLADIAAILRQGSIHKRLPRFVQTPTALRLLTFMAKNGQLDRAADVLGSCAIHGDMQEQTAPVATEIMLELTEYHRPGAFSRALRLLSALPKAHQTLTLYNALIRAANLSFSQRADADAASGQVEEMLARRTDLTPDTETIEARLLAPPRAAEVRGVEYTFSELIMRSIARARTYDELYDLSLEHGSTFRRETWNLTLAAVGREAGYFRSREVIDWMTLHGVKPDMSTFNTILHNSLFAQGRTGQMSLKVFRNCLQQLIRQEPTFKPDIDTYLHVVRALVSKASRHFAAEPLRALFDFYARKTELPGYPAGGLLGLAIPAPTPSETWVAEARNPDNTLPRLTFEFPPTLDFDKHVRGVYDLFEAGFQRRFDFAAVDALVLARRRAIQARRRMLEQQRRL